jgi:hypothetical protein
VDIRQYSHDVPAAALLNWKIDPVARTGLIEDTAAAAVVVD